MTAHSVHWNEGMFLCPHHVQLAERLGQQQRRRGQQWNQHYSWGLRTLDLDVPALADFRFVVRALGLRLRDGTLVAVPEDATLPPLDLKPALQKKDSVLLSLAVPQLQLGKRNTLEPEGPPPEDPSDLIPSAEPAAEDETPGETRYLVDTQELEDENTGDNPQPIQVRLLNARLMVSGQPEAGYEILPIARVVRSSATGALPELDSNYIPPVLACDAWPPLQAGILQAVYDLVGKHIEVLAKQALSRGITFDSRYPGSLGRLGLLQALNTAYASLTVLAFAEGIHPLPAYLELCRLVGQVAVFGAGRRVPELPRYDHDDLAGCFYRVKQYLFDLLVEEATWEERQFVGAGLHLQVAMEEKWLQPAWQMFVGVRSPLNDEECVRLITRQGQLDMKIGSAARVDNIFDRGEAGLKFTAAAQAPQLLPVEPGLVYFQVSRESKQEEWQNVQQSRTLAVRVNLNRIENRVGGTIEGLRQLHVKAGGKTVVMEFTLYLVPLVP